MYGNKKEEAIRVNKKINRIRKKWNICDVPQEKGATYLREFAGNSHNFPTTFPQLSRNFPETFPHLPTTIPESHNPQFPGSRNSQPASSDSCTGVYTRYTRPKNLKKKECFLFLNDFLFYFE